MSASITVAVLGAALSLNGVFRGWEWFIPAMTVVCTVSLALAFLRTFKVPPPLASLGGLASLVFILAFTFFRPESIAGFIPSGATFNQVGRFLQRAGETVVSETAPVAPNAGIVLVACAGLGLAVILIDALAVPLGMPATSGVGLLCVLVFPATIKPQGAGLPGFLAAAVGYLLIMGCSQWFAPDSRLQTGNVRGAGQLKRSVVIGSVALVLGLLLPLAVPGFEHGTFPVGSRLNPWGVSNGLNPMITLGNSLRNPTGDGRITFATTSTAPLYLRSVTIDKFDGDTWTPDDRESSRRLGAGRITPDYPLPDEQVSQMTVVDTGQFTSPYLPVPYAPTAVNGLSGRWTWDPFTLSIRAEDTTSRNQQYTAYSALPSVTAVELSQANAKPTSISQDFTQLPGNVPDIVRNVAAAVTKDEPSNYAKAMAIQDYLRSSQFSYSLQAPVQGGYDGNGLSVLADFLEQKSGYCVHFASAMAVMARLSGIPSRIAVGYAPGHSTGLTVAVAGQEPLPEFAVDARDAHAWPELYFEGYGWIAFEPTPSRGVVPPYAMEATAAGGASINLHDENLVPGAATPGPSTSAAPPPSVSGAVSATGAGTGTTPYIFAGALLLAALAASPRLIRSGIRARRLRSTPDAPLLAWAELQDLATDYGVTPVPNETPRHFAARLAKSPVLASTKSGSPAETDNDAGQRALSTVTRDFERQRYGRPAGSPSTPSPSTPSPPAGKQTESPKRDLAESEPDTVERIAAIRSAMRRNSPWFRAFRAEWLPPSLMSNWSRVVSLPFGYLGRMGINAGSRVAASLRKLPARLRWRR
ncbi:DUF3488 and DUF4129 domain-containing transglutaminase family protein [bacterium RCC_150]